MPANGRRSEHPRPEAADPIAESPVGGDDVDDTLTGRGGHLDDPVVAAAGRVDDLDTRHA